MVVSANLSSFGQINGEQITKFTLKNNVGMVVELMNYGASLISCYVPNKYGVFENVVLGFNQFEDYVKDECYIGCMVGRVAGRIRSGRFFLDGVTNILQCNDLINNCHLHGGHNSINKKIWKWRCIDDVSVSFVYTSPVGENGYPANLHITTTYTLSPDEFKLSINMSAISDAETPVNLTNHSYFNLDGFTNNNGGCCFDHYLFINSSHYLKCGNDLLPTGELQQLISKEESMMNFKTSKKIGESIEALKNSPIRGYDHFYCLDADSFKKISAAAVVYSDKSGRKMRMTTNQPGIHFYSGNFLSHQSKTIENASVQPYLCFCLEAQGYPNAVNEPSFPSQILYPSAVYSKFINLYFSTE